MLKHLGVGRAAGGEKPPKSEGGSGASHCERGFYVQYLLEKSIIYLDICVSIRNFELSLEGRMHLGNKNKMVFILYFARFK